VAERIQLFAFGGVAVMASRGVSLLELLVAQALGLLLMLGLLKSVTDQLDQQRQNEDRTELRESSQLLSTVLRHSLSPAGFVDWTVAPLGASSPQLPGGAALFACPGDMLGSARQHASAAPTDWPHCGTVRARRETLQVVRQGADKDCLQQSVSGPWVVDRWYVSTSSLGSQLLCAGAGNPSGQALVAGVEEWVFRFLVQHPNGHTQWFYTAEMGPANDPRWQGVVRLEVCWVLSSSAQGRGGSQAHRIQGARPTCQRGPDGQWLPGVLRAAGDRRLWQRHTQTLALLNTPGVSE
jgi:type II secretory pathway component PulJ